MCATQAWSIQGRVKFTACAGCRGAFLCPDCADESCICGECFVVNCCACWEANAVFCDGCEEEVCNGDRCFTDACVVCQDNFCESCQDNGATIHCDRCDERFCETCREWIYCDACGEAACDDCGSDEVLCDNCDETCCVECSDKVRPFLLLDTIDAIGDL